MAGKILHVNEDFYLNKDLTTRNLLKVLDEIALQFINSENFSIDITTADGEYHYDLSSEQVYNLFLENKEVINSLTLSQIQSNPNIPPTSLTLYLKQVFEKQKISIAIASSSDEENRLIEEFLLEKLQTEKEITTKATEISLSDTFHFNASMSRRELAHIIRKIDERILPNLEVEIDILTKNDSLILLGEHQLGSLKEHLWESKRKIVSIHKQSRNGSNFELNLYFEDDRSGYGTIEMESNSKSKNASARNLILEGLRLNKRQLTSHKMSVSKRPYLQGQFEIDGSLSTDEIVDFLEFLSKNFIPQEELELRFISTAHKSYCYSESDCKVLRDLFRRNREGLLYATKNVKELYFINICISFRSLTHAIGYYYIALPTSVDNEKALNFVKEGLQPRTRKEAQALIEKPNLQDAFYFDPTISAGQLIWFLKTLSTDYLQGEAISVRLTTLNGNKHYFYDENFLDLIEIFEENTHDNIYISKKSADGRSITINLHFKGNTNLPNCFYSVIMNDFNKLQQIKESIIHILQEYQETGPHLAGGIEQIEVLKNCGIFLSKSSKISTDKLTAPLKSLGLNAIPFEVEEETYFSVARLSDLDLVLFDVSHLSDHESYLLGMLRALSKRTILLAEETTTIPGYLKGHAILRSNEKNLPIDQLNMTIADTMTS